MAARFWVPLTVTNVTDNGGGLVRITVGAGLATGKVTGETVVVAGVTGATGANGTFTITAVSSTTFDLNASTFGGVYVNGGTVSGGTWNATNIGNWGTSSGTGSGASVPGTSDDVTLDASSGGATVTVSSPNGAGVVTVLSITCGAFTGTLDFAVNDNNVTLTSNTGFVGSGTGVRTINLGDGTWTLSGQGTVWNLATTTNLTFAANSSTISLSNTSNSGAATFSGGGKTYNAVTVAAGGSGGTGFGKQFTVAGANTFSALTIGAGVRFIMTVSVTQTVTTFSFTGTQLKPGVIESTTPGSGAATLSVASGTVTLDWIMMVAGITFSGGATFTATNTFNFNSTGLTATVPSFGGGIISG